MMSFALTIVFVTIPALAEPPPSEIRHDCKSTKEYITTREYFEKSDQLSLDASQVEQVAHDVSKSCTGAAARFIRSFEVLMKVELGTRNSLRLALELAKKNDAFTDSFLGVFQRAFLKEYLDLDLATSVNLAQSLSLDYKGDVKRGVKDFIDLTKYCLDVSKVGLSLPQCAKMAGELAKAGENFDKAMAPAYFEIYEFLTTEDGLTMPVGDAFNLAQKIVLQSPYAVDNFISAYRYAAGWDGMDRSAKEALIFAQQMSERTNQISDANRTPAQQPPIRSN